MGYLNFELRRLLRIRTLLGAGTVGPLAFYLIFSFSGRDDPAAFHRGVPLSLYAVVVVAGIGAMIGVLSHSAGVAYERADRFLSLLRVTPLPPSSVVVVRAVVSLLTALPPLVVIAVVASLLHDLELPPVRWALLLVAMWLGAVPLALLGLAMGFTLSREATGPVTNLAWIALAVAGGLFIPVESFPAGLQAAATLTPTFRYAELGWSVVGGDAPPAAGLGILSGWVVVFGLLAALAYRRSTAAR